MDQHYEEQMNNLTVIVKKYDEINNTLTVTFDTDEDLVSESREYTFQLHNFNESNIDNIIKTMAKSGLSTVKQELKFNQMVSDQSIKNKFKEIEGKSITFSINELETVEYPTSNTSNEVII